MNRQWTVCASIALALGLTLLAVALGSGAAVPALAGPNLFCVNPSGSGCSAECGGGCFASVQAAVDAAPAGGEIRIAGGTYTQAGGTVATIDKELHVSGGYDPPCAAHDPDVHETVLDAQWGGSVISISHAGDVVLSHLTLTHGDGTGNCQASVGCGGGIYASHTPLHVQHCKIVDNVGSSAAGSAAGGGLYAYESMVQIHDSRIIDNIAGTAATTSYAEGGGVFIKNGEAELVRNEILRNTGSYSMSGSGGVQLVTMNYARVVSNTIRDNRSTEDSIYWSGAGGLGLEQVAYADVIGNRIESNGCSGVCYGGGVFVWDSSAHLSRNVIAGNTCSTPPFAGDGAGVSILGTQPVTLSNNLIVNNDVGMAGAGVYVEGRSPACQARLFHNTITGNGIYGIHTYLYGNVSMVNNLLAGHDVGIHIETPFTATVEADTNLFWNGSDPLTGANPVLADPHLAADHRLRAGSPAVDAGLDVPWLVVDLEGRPRPMNGLWDIGAFEGVRETVFLPLIARQLPPGLAGEH